MSAASPARAAVSSLETGKNIIFPQPGIFHSFVFRWFAAGVTQALLGGSEERQARIVLLLES